VQINTLSVENEDVGQKSGNGRACDELEKGNHQYAEAQRQAAEVFRAHGKGKV
jgi:hypothetical protein